MMDESSYAIDIKNLTKSFDDKCVVNNISLQVKRGEVFGFLGPNGSGKTTTIRMLCGLLTPDSGEGFCLGYDILRQSEEIKRCVGYMTQKFSLYDDLSVYENLNFIARLYLLPDREKKIKVSLDNLGISIKRSRQLAGQLSGGWKQRLALAAATIHNPQLLLLDEPTAGVDPKARREFWDEIHRLSTQGITTLVTTHYMDEAERCHRLAYISFGQLIVSGTLQEFVSHSGLRTWEVTGPHLSELTKQLEKYSNLYNVTHFGNALHISCPHKDELEQMLPLQREPYHWKEIMPTMEDVFIHYSKNSKDNFSE